MASSVADESVKPPRKKCRVVKHNGSDSESDNKASPTLAATTGTTTATSSPRATTSGSDTDTCATAKPKKKTSTGRATRGSGRAKSGGKKKKNDEKEEVDAAGEVKEEAKKKNTKGRRSSRRKDKDEDGNVSKEDDQGTEKKGKKETAEKTPAKAAKEKTTGKRSRTKTPKGSATRKKKDNTGHVEEAPLIHEETTVAITTITNTEKLYCNDQCVNVELIKENKEVVQTEAAPCSPKPTTPIAPLDSPISPCPSTPPSLQTVSLDQRESHSLSDLTHVTSTVVSTSTLVTVSGTSVTPEKILDPPLCVGAPLTVNPKPPIKLPYYGRKPKASDTMLMRCHNRSTFKSGAETPMWSISTAARGFIGDRPENQDVFLIDFSTENPLFGVFDGHGIRGAEASGDVAESIVKHIASTPYGTDTRATLTEAFKVAQAALVSKASKYPLETCEYGTTAAAVIVNGGFATCAWAGDTRAVLCHPKRPQTSSTATFTPLSIDHSLYSDDEQKRIQNCGGVIIDKNKVRRILPSTIDYSYAQIAEHKLALNMSRSLGHIILGKYGVIAVPDVVSMQINDGDRLVVASDGLWNLCTNAEVAEFVQKSSTADGACLALCTEVKERCRQRKSRADNTTVVVAFFHSKNDDDSDDDVIKVQLPPTEEKPSSRLRPRQSKGQKSPTPRSPSKKHTRKKSSKKTSQTAVSSTTSTSAPTSVPVPVPEPAPAPAPAPAPTPTPSSTQIQLTTTSRNEMDPRQSRAEVPPQPIKPAIPAQSTETALPETHQPITALKTHEPLPTSTPTPTPTPTSTSTPSPTPKPLQTNAIRESPPSSQVPVPEEEQEEQTQHNQQQPQQPQEPCQPCEEAHPDRDEDEDDEEVVFRDDDRPLDSPPVSPLRPPVSPFSPLSS
ncbi:protein phosphatase 2C [Pelomyxa schiedti]|nr:protein phosphatase 2C [Pelomyxa schiedti]